MLDLKFIRDNPDLVKKGTASKKRDSKLVDEVLTLDEKRREILMKIESLRAKRNTLSKDNVQEGKKLKEELNGLEPKLKEIEGKLYAIQTEIPNLPAKDVKEGKNDSENEVVKKWGEPPKFNFPAKDHLDLGIALELIDVEKGGKVSGTRFAYLKNEAVLLEFALVQFALKNLIAKGFSPIIPPVLIKRKSMWGMGYLENGGEEDMFNLPKDNLFLVGTSEQAIGPMHSDEIIDSKKLPLRYVGFSSCFRREAGSYGKDTRGILRVHQFDKVEMFSFVKKEDDDKEHDFLLSLEEEMVQKLKIPYQVVKMCTGDLGHPAARKYDLEAWMPGQNKYREITSTSTVTDYQARRLNIRYKKSDGKVEFVHMLNGTAFAIGRMIIAILENYQQKDGSIKIPDVLQEYVGKKEIIRK